MWMLIVAMSYVYAGSFLLMPEKYGSDQECQLVGTRAVKEDRAKGFRCINVAVNQNK